MHAMSLQLHFRERYTLILGNDAVLAIVFAVAAVAVLWTLIFAKVRGTKVRLLLLVLVPILAICAPISSGIVRTILVPVETAEVALPGLDATLRLEFYDVLDWRNDSGRRLILTTATGEVRQHISAVDWAHWPRTSIYLLDDGRIAVLGPTYDDYIVDPKRRTIDGLWHGTASDTWRYFGAFDFKGQNLGFIPASEQRECTPTRGITDPTATRPQGRDDRCHQGELKN
jgi:hypothetical protein